MLRPGGQLIFMVYYAYSYRRFVQAPRPTLSQIAKELIGHRGVVATTKDSDRAAYDASESGEGAPHTDWISKRSLRHLCRNFGAFSSTIENIDNGKPFTFARPRAELLKTSFPRRIGLDFYATATK